MQKLSDTINRKFINSFDVGNWEIETDSGWVDITSVHQTVEYEEWELTTEKNKQLVCADNHIVFDNEFNEIFVKDLVPDLSSIVTKDGIEKVTSVRNLNKSSNMYDITVDSVNHRYYTNNILSHNSQLLAAYMVWYILFNEHKTAAVLANKQDIAVEILGRVQFIIENLPPWLQQGIVEWNKKSVELENGSSCFAAATSPSAIRGKSVSLLALDEFGHLDIGMADEFIKSVFPTISSAESAKMILISCVTKDTYVFSDKGIKQVSDFIDSKQIVNPSIGYLVPEYKIAGLNKTNSGNVMVNSGKTDTRIITSKSSQLECSLNHKLWACKNGTYAWYESGNLEVGDYISINYGQNVWGNNDDISDYTPYVTKRFHNEFLPGDKITTDLAYVLGLYLAEGYSDKYCTTITCGDDISDSLSVLNLPIGYGGLKYYISSVAFVEFLKYLGFDITKKAKEKTIPKRLLECSKEILCSFISGMFDGDGCAKKNGKISYASASLELIKQLRMILLNLGITTQIYKAVIKPTYRVVAHSTLYTIEINSYFDCNMFYDTVGFRLTRKQQRQQLLKMPLKNLSKDVIPFGRDVLKNNGIIHKEPAYFKATPHISRKTCLSIEGVEKLSGIISPNIKWEKITSIEESTNEVFDFSLDHIDNDFWCHSVLYNGIIGHQTPKGLNHFYKLWHDAEHGMNDFVPVEGKWQENPNRTQEWADKQLKELGKVGFQQEIECIGGETLITVKDITTGKVFTTAIQNIHESLEYKDNYPDAENWLKINRQYEIMTPTGFQPFDGVNRVKKLVLVIKTTTSTIRVSQNHIFIVNDKQIKASTVRKGHNLALNEKVLSVTLSERDYLYDPVNVGTDHIYYAGGFVHHNCSFIGSSYTLIDGNKLAAIPYTNPIYHKAGLEVFKKPVEGNSYVICIDTSRGVHQDYSAFTVIDVTKMPYEVVVVFKDNAISTLEFPHLIFNTARQYNNAYLLVEINDLGEEVSNTIWYEYEYENIYFTKKDRLTEGRGFPGVRTTSKVKMLGCSVLKDLIEKDQLILNSFSIIEELGLFVLKNRSYATDDPVINDDLCTTLWLFAWLTKQNEFQELVNIHLRSIIAKRKQEYIDQSMTPFMFYDDGKALDHLLEDSKVLPSKEMPNYLTQDQIELLMS